MQSLAQRASKAAGEIKDLINNSKENVEDGSNLVVDAGKIMQEIARSIEGVTTMMANMRILQPLAPNKARGLNNLMQPSPIPKI